MLLERDSKNYSSRIRRKAYDVDNPELRYACTGLSMCKTYGLALNKNNSDKNYAEFV